MPSNLNALLLAFSGFCQCVKTQGGPPSLRAASCPSCFFNSPSNRHADCRGTEAAAYSRRTWMHRTLTLLENKTRLSWEPPPSLPWSRSYLEEPRADSKCPRCLRPGHLSLVTNQQPQASLSALGMFLPSLPFRNIWNLLFVVTNFL